MTELKEKLAPLKGGLKVRFGLVAVCRDKIIQTAPPPGWYVTKPFCNLEEGADHSADSSVDWIPSRKRRTAAQRTLPGRVAGLKFAIKDKGMGWNPNGPKLIILIGDAGVPTGGESRIRKMRPSRAS